MKLRTELPETALWDLSSCFSSLEAWQEEYSTFHYDHLQEYKGLLSEGPARAAQCLAAFFEAARRLDRIVTYAHLKHDEDTRDATWKGAYQQASFLAHQFGADTAWIEVELVHIPATTATMYQNDPLLEPYAFYLQKIFHLQSHTLTEAEERLLALAAAPLQTAAKTFQALNNADLQFSPVTDSQGTSHPLTHGSYGVYLRSQDRVLRKHAFFHLHQEFDQHKNTLAELLYGQAQAHAFSAKAKGYTSSLEQALFPKNIPLTVYHGLIEAVRSYLPSLHRYVHIRKQVLELSTLHAYDLYVPLFTPSQELIPYEQAEEWVIASVAPLGEEYQSILARGLRQEHWVDRYETPYKRSGAYSSGCYDSAPYILMNYKGTWKDVFTLAHEAGHSMHSWLSHHTQSYQNSHYPIFLAEIASTLNEALLTDFLLKQKVGDPAFLLHEHLEEIRTTLFRQTLFAEFELRLHQEVEQGQPVTSDRLSDWFTELNQAYFGPDYTMDAEGRIEWARIPHFYYNFYVYQYATGIAAALALVDPILKGDQSAQAAYLHFLRAGGSQFPMDLLGMAGLDMNQPVALHQALSRFDHLVSQLESFF